MHGMQFDSVSADKIHATKRGKLCPAAQRDFQAKKLPPKSHHGHPQATTIEGPKPCERGIGEDPEGLDALNGPDLGLHHLTLSGSSSAVNHSPWSLHEVAPGSLWSTTECRIASGFENIKRNAPNE